MSRMMRWVGCSAVLGLAFGQPYAAALRVYPDAFEHAETRLNEDQRIMAHVSPGQISVLQGIADRDYFAGYVGAAPPARVHVDGDRLLQRRRPRP